MRAEGTFDVQLPPQAEDKGEGSTLGRRTIIKQFHGDLAGSSRGEMLAALMDGGSAVYVAIERVTGTLQGRQGSFVLVHNGVSTAEGQSLTISVAPGSGTRELAGLAGHMTLRIEDGHHFYDLEYTLPAGE